MTLGEKKKYGKSYIFFKYLYKSLLQDLSSVFCSSKDVIVIIHILGHNYYDYIQMVRFWRRLLKINDATRNA